MIPDAEIVSMVCSILSKLDVGEFTIKVLYPINAYRHLG
jgi:histidyl-tRNA synthetase